MSMAVSMEVRVPLLEPEFVEYALSVPFHWKLNRRGSKQVMRETFQNLLSPAVRHGAKRGFNVPLGIWMRDSLDEYFVASETPGHKLRDSLGNDVGSTWRDDGFLKASSIEWMRREHRAGRQDLSHELFAIVIFDVWWRKYVTQTLPISGWSAIADN
jgi:asparagine synthase (glutamine-hydrolysing)